MMRTHLEQPVSMQATAQQLRMLIPEVAREFRERMQAGSGTGPAYEGDLRTFLEQLAEAMESGRPPETAVARLHLADERPDFSQVRQSLDRALQKHHLLQRVLVEVLEANAPLAQDARFFIEDAFHAVERQAALTHVSVQDERVRDSEARLGALVESNILGVVQTSLDGQVKEANDAFLDLVGYTRADLSSGALDWRAITPPEYRELDERYTDQVMETGRCDLYEKEYLRKDGSRVTVLVGKALTHRQSGECITYVLDRTRFKELENALRERAEEIQQANERLNQFLSMIAHEMRTPLATISNALYLLENLALSDKAARQVSVASRQTRHAARLVNDLMDLSRIARGKIELRREPVSLRRLAADAVESARPLMDSFGHQLTATYASEPLWVNADPLRVEQIINNLLANAAKYTEPGGCIQLSVRRKGEFAVLSIRDNGIGIDPQKLPRIFDLYEQFGLSETRSHGGLGIGLPLVKRLVELQGGSVEAYSEGPGKGSEFEVALPLLADSSAG